MFSKRTDAATVVIDTTKIQLFKQITTKDTGRQIRELL